MGSVFLGMTVPRARRFPNFFEMSASIGFESWPRPCRPGALVCYDWLLAIQACALKDGQGFGCISWRQTRSK